MSQVIFYCVSQLIFYRVSQIIFYCVSQIIFYCVSQIIFYCVSQIIFYRVSHINFYCVSQIRFYGVSQIIIVSNCLIQEIIKFIKMAFVCSWMIHSFVIFRYWSSKSTFKKGVFFLLLYVSLGCRIRCHMF